MEFTFLSLQEPYGLVGKRHGKQLKLKSQKDITSAITMVLLLMCLMLFMRFSMLD